MGVGEYPVEPENPNMPEPGAPDPEVPEEEGEKYDGGPIPRSEPSTEENN